MDISSLRKEYQQRLLQRDSLAKSPFDQFERWFQEAQTAEVLEPHAMVLATASKLGRPSSRSVLLKKFSPEGFVFFTDRRSNKGKDLAENPFAAVTFWWKELERQVNIQGKIELSPDEESDVYFKSRPRGSQLAVLSSQQGALISSRAELEKEYERLKAIYEGKDIPRPDYWGGYHLIPDSFEFWQGRPNRLHDRFSYVLDGKNWTIERLSP